MIFTTLRTYLLVGLHDEVHYADVAPSLTRHDMPDHLISDLVSTPDGVWFRAGVPDVSKKLRKMLEKICTRGYSGGSSYLIYLIFFFRICQNGNRNYFPLYHKDLKCRLTLSTSLNTVVPANAAQLQLTQRDTN